ncbi:CbtA family protein [Pseudomonas fluorescens]|uniref:CbtA family protein n=1 Tax=Pseudomonas fluorescens TaxID=294 RepID=UPI00124119D6|nr:CbtA family protein [Pseudomonas fluorescens]VVN43771.1 hypothetical protein PS676_05561 [Pseudomonas fluorescens]
MTGRLLIQGMVAGLLAGILAFAFATVVGEPQIELAIAYEDGMSQIHQHSHAQTEGEASEAGEMVSREVQSTYGLLTGMLVYSVSLGGIYALVFAYAIGRTGVASPRSLAALLALAAFIVIFLIPGLKYPANPPATNIAETIDVRTLMFFLMILVSVVTAIVALSTTRRLIPSLGSWNATFLGLSLYIAVMATTAFMLPSTNEIPDDFPAVVLWKFRTASIGIHLVLWASMGLIFGLLVEKLPSGRSHFSRAKIV